MTVYEKTSEFARFGGPIQFASNALSVLKEIDDNLFDRVMDKFTFTGIRTCGIKDGVCVCVCVCDLLRTTELHSSRWISSMHSFLIPFYFLLLSGLRSDGSFRMTDDSLDYLVNPDAPADWFVKFPLKECADLFGLRK